MIIKNNIPIKGEFYDKEYFHLLIFLRFPLKKTNQNTTQAIIVIKSR